MKKFCLLILAVVFCITSYGQYIDLGLPSGTKWKSSNETAGNNGFYTNYGFYTYDQAVKAFGDKLPTEEQWKELKDKCKWEWMKNEDAYKVTGPNGNSIRLIALGGRSVLGGLYHVGERGHYWSSSLDDSGKACYFGFDSDYKGMGNSDRDLYKTVRLVQKSSRQNNDSWLPSGTTGEDKSEKKSSRQNNDSGLSSGTRGEDKSVKDTYSDEYVKLPRQYVDLGLPSGIKWMSKNEDGLYSYNDAVKKFGNKLPTREQMLELKDECSWTWTGKGYKITGPNGKSIYLPASGSRNCDGVVDYVGSRGFYCTSTPFGSDHASGLYIRSDGVYMSLLSLCFGHSVRLVQDPPRQNNDSGLQSGTTGTVKNEKVSNNSEESRQYVDLGLPSGTKWTSKNEDGLYNYDDAVKKFGDKLPTKEQLEELKDKCKWTWIGIGTGYEVTGPNGKSIVLPVAGYRSCDGDMYYVGLNGEYWSSTPSGSNSAWDLGFSSYVVSMYSSDRRCQEQSVRLVQKSSPQNGDSGLPSGTTGTVKNENVSNNSEESRQYVDLGLPSGTKWKSKNEDGLYNYNDAVKKYGDKLPTKAQLEELKDKCKWTWSGNGYRVTGPNGKSIVLPAAGYHYCGGDVISVGSCGNYWSSIPIGSDSAWYLFFSSDGMYMGPSDSQCSELSVRLVQK